MPRRRVRWWAGSPRNSLVLVELEEGGGSGPVEWRALARFAAQPEATRRGEAAGCERVACIELVLSSPDSTTAEVGSGWDAGIC